MQRYGCDQRNATGAGGRGYPISEQPTSNPVTPGDRPAGSASRRDRLLRRTTYAMAIGLVLMVTGAAAAQTAEWADAAGLWSGGLVYLGGLGIRTVLGE